MEYVFILTCSTGILGVYRDYTDAERELAIFKKYRFAKLKIEQHPIS